MTVIPYEWKARSSDNQIRNCINLKTAKNNVTDSSSFEGLWRSEGGSIYVCGGDEFICLNVHSSYYRGWIGKIAVKNIRSVGAKWIGLQAFRNSQTGQLTGWEPIELKITDTKVTKYFSRSISKGFLVYGHIEHYYRINLQ